MPVPMAEQSAVLVPVPEAEPTVSRHRARLDRTGAWGVPAHATILYPFVAPPTITAAMTAALTGAVASARAFDCQFRTAVWFGQDVLWLAPRPAGGSSPDLAVSAAFPGCLRYGGAHQDAVRHLTAGDRLAGGAADLRAAGTALLRDLPITAYQPGVADDRHDCPG